MNPIHLFLYDVVHLLFSNPINFCIPHKYNFTKQIFVIILCKYRACIKTINDLNADELFVYLIGMNVSITSMCV